MTNLPFTCPFCKDEFTSPESLRQHRIVNHKNEISEFQPPPRKVRRKQFKPVKVDLF